MSRTGASSAFPEGRYSEPKASANDEARGWSLTKSQAWVRARSTVTAARVPGAHSSRKVWPHQVNGGRSGFSRASAALTRSRDSMSAV